MNLNIFSLDIKKFLNFLILFFPVSFIIGNAAVNLDILLISITGIFFYKKEIFRIEKDFVLFLIIFFFIFIIISTFIEHYENFNNLNLVKSILYLRYLIFLLVLNCMVKKNDFNFRYFIFSCFFFSIIASLTVIHEGITGKSFFHDGSHILNNPGIFGDELISGSYILKFGCLGLFFIPLTLKNEKKKLLFFFTIAIIFFSLSIILSGNRMPLLLFGLFLFLGIFLVKKIRFAFILGSISAILIFLVVINTDKNIKNNWNSFYGNVYGFVFSESESSIVDELKKDYSDIKIKADPKERTPGLEKWKFDYAYWKRKNWKGFKPVSFGSGHRIIWTTAIETWLDSPIIGSGIKSFREKCKNKLNTPHRVCQSHTHNYYLEILNDTGLVGLILIVLTTYILLVRKFQVMLLNKSLDNFIFYSIFFNLILEFFPFRSSGNFFSTYSSSFIFLLIGLFLNYKINTKINH